jgi:hypothetical protein
MPGEIGFSKPQNNDSVSALTDWRLGVFDAQPTGSSRSTVIVTLKLGVAQIDNGRIVGGLCLAHGPVAYQSKHGAEGKVE